MADECNFATLVWLCNNLDTWKEALSHCRHC